MRHKIAVVASSLVLLQFLSVSAAADVPRGSDPGRRPSGKRTAATRSLNVTAASSCSVTGEGRVLCWGTRESITLASDDVPFSDPVQIAGVSNAIAVGVGRAHACALRGDGKVVCWGENGDFQLGREPVSGFPQPAGEVTNLSDVAQVAVGSMHNCAVRSDSQVVCWGSNFRSALGQTNDVEESATPLEVDLNPGAMMVTAGEFHTCALRKNGTVACWGSNIAGQVAQASNADNIRRPEAIGLFDVVEISAGFEHTCALIADGGVACWGRNQERQVDISAASPRAFAGIPGVSNVMSLAASASGACALIANGTLRCWGASQSSVTEPDVTGAVEVGPRLAVTAVGYLKSFSPNSPTVSRADPERTKARSIALGANHSCVRRMTGTLSCWGENGLAQLGDGTATDRPTPVTVLDGGTHPAVGASVAAGSVHGCMRTPTGGAQCWGDNTFGQAGDPSRGGTRQMFTVIEQGTTPLANVVAVTNGTNHSCALLANGRAKCWGSNADGQLGDGTRTTPASPANAVTVGLQNIRAIAAGGRHTCALMVDGPAMCWGANDTGQVTGQAGNDITWPVEVGAEVAAIAPGEHHTCVLGYDSVRCRGWNASGQLGPEPDLPGFHFVSADAVGVAVGDAHSCALKADGTILCWGENGSGQLGNASFTDSTTPVTVKEQAYIPCSLPGGVCTVVRPIEKMIAIDAGGAHTCGIRGDGEPFCWGKDSSGQLGDNTSLSNKSTARPVTNFY